MKKDMKEILEGSLHASMDKIKGMKLHACRENNGHADIPPLVLVGKSFPTEGEDEMRIGVGAVMMEMENGENPADHLPILLSQLYEKVGMEDVVFLAFLVEGFARNTEAKTYEQALTEHQQFGSMEDDFRNNPNSDVQEGLIATIYGMDGTSAHMACFYKYGDDGLPIYEDDNEISWADDLDEQGRVPSIFHSFIKYHDMATLVKGVDTDDDEKVEIPTYEEVFDFLVDDTQHDQLPPKLADFMARAYSIVIAREMMEAIKEKYDNGDIILDEFIAKAQEAFESGDHEKISAYIGETVAQFSLTGNALLTAKKGVPDDISELLGNE
jgi:hypothetical protein